MSIVISFLETEKLFVFKPVLKKLIRDFIAEEGKKLGEIAIILTNNNNLLEINKEFLNHHYYTDVITFPAGKRNLLSGDIYISVDQVKLNAEKYRVSFYDELVRVIIHGFLHLIGYEDLTVEQKQRIRKKEDYYLCRFRKYDIIKSGGSRL